MKLIQKRKKSRCTQTNQTSADRTVSSSLRDRGASQGNRLLFEIAPGWAIGCDRLQWMLIRQRSAGFWYPVSFVATERRILERCIREKGVPMTHEGRARLNTLPGTFREYRNTA